MNSAPPGSGIRSELNAKNMRKHTYQGVAFRLNNRYEEIEPQGEQPYSFADEQRGVVYSVTVLPGTTVMIMLELTDALKELRPDEIEKYYFDVSPDRYAELTTDAGDVFSYNIMTTRYKDGSGLHIAKVCSGKIIVTVYAQFQEKGEEESVLTETKRILHSLRIDEEEAVQSITSTTGSNDRKMIGNETVGFVSVPDTWVEFHDLKGVTDFQYSSLDGNSIITMNTFDTSGLTEEQRAALNAKSAASAVWSNLENRDVTDISGAEVRLSVYDAFQVCGLFISEDYGLKSGICCWIFEDGSGVLHYVSAEAPVESLPDIIAYVEDSFTLNPPVL